MTEYCDNDACDGSCDIEEVPASDIMVIGLTGLARAGKDSVADVLVREHGFVKASFAAPLKRMTRNLNPIVGHSRIVDMEDGSTSVVIGAVYLQDLYDWGWTEDQMKVSQYGEEVRRIWQRFGTDVMRAEEDDYWIKAAGREIERLLDAGHPRIVFTDTRFPNEAEFIYSLAEKYNGSSSVWQVSRPGVVLQEGAHVSEQHVGRMGEEFQIHNDGTLADLSEVVAVGVNYAGFRRRFMLSAQDSVLEFIDYEGAK